MVSGVLLAGAEKQKRPVHKNQSLSVSHPPAAVQAHNSPISRDDDRKEWRLASETWP
jgi:hypothetical protein